jgi:hypothetical protein
MRTIRTTKCHDHGQLELTLAFDASKLPEADARWFAGVLEQMVEAGSRFAAGQSLQIGWSIVWFVAQPGDSLGFEEPDMTSIPLARQPGLTNALAHLRLQKDTLESVLPPDALAFPTLRESCLVCTRLAPSIAFLMDRHPPEGMDCGWFIGCQEEDHDHNDLSALKKVSLYEAVVARCPRALPYLAFPPSAMIAVDDAPTFFLEGEPLEVKKGSFVDAQRSRSGRG